MKVPRQHYVNGHPLAPPFPEGLELAMFGMGCFWGAERVFWKTPGVFSTAVGYAAGVTPDPDYERVCSGLTGHAEVVRQYRSGIYVYTTEQRRLAEASRDAYQRVLVKAGHGRITTEILDAPEFYYAEEYHQQYLAKNPGGYCGLGGTGVACPTGVLASAGDTR